MTITTGSRIPNFPRAPRWRQFTAALACRSDDASDRRIRALLADERQWMLVSRLPAYDRRHVLGVHDRLLATGYSDPELLRAALLHDAGKADCRARVGITHRVLRVLLKRFAPGLLGRLATGRPRSHRLYLAEHHARLGAEAARHAGASERCCWLIANHERDVAHVTDSELLALIAADEGTALP